MAKIHPNWLIHEHVGEDHADLVKVAKAGSRGPAARKPIERAVKPAGETRKKKAPKA